MKNMILIVACLVANVIWAQSETTTIYLVRHAEKADASADPDLSEAGKARAKKWGEYFEDKNIGIYFSTPYKRTTNTAAIISSFVSALPVPGTTRAFQMRGYDPAALSLQKLADDNKGKNIVVVGHSNTIPAQINTLIGEKKYADIPESEFGNLYIIKVTGDTVTHELVKM